MKGDISKASGMASGGPENTSMARSFFGGQQPGSMGNMGMAHSPASGIGSMMPMFGGGGRPPMQSPMMQQPQQQQIAPPQMPNSHLGQMVPGGGFSGGQFNQSPELQMYKQNIMQPQSGIGPSMGMGGFQSAPGMFGRGGFG